MQTQARLGVSRPAVLVTSRQHVYTSDPISDTEAFPVELLAPSRSERRRRHQAPPILQRAFHVDVDHLIGAVERSARRHRAELVHVHWPSGIGRAATRAAGALCLPTVAELRFDLAGAMLAQSANGYGRTLEPMARRWFERHVRHAAAVVVASDALGTLVNRTHALCEDRLATVPNGISAAFVAACDAARADRADALSDTGRVTLGTTSKMLRYEGLETLLDCAAALPDIDLVFIGDGPERSRLEASAEPLNRERAGRVRFAGAVPAAAIPALLIGIDIFAVPRHDLSITRYASPIKVIEAMAAACCTVASAVGDQARLLEHGRGVLVPPGDTPAFIAAIAACAKDAEHRRRLGVAARQHAIERYDGDALITRYADVYRRALA